MVSTRDKLEMFSCCLRALESLGLRNVRCLTIRHASPAGKLGHGNENGHSTPKRVEALVGLVVSMIACGSRHTAVVTSPEGNLYTW